MRVCPCACACACACVGVCGCVGEGLGRILDWDMLIFIRTLGEASGLNVSL